MRKISLALVALMGLTGVAYGANWVQIGHASDNALFIAPAEPHDCVWEKMQYSVPQRKAGEYFDKIVSLTKVNCAAAWTKELQISIYLGNHVLESESVHEPKQYAAPGTASAVLLNAVCSKK
ncbi:MULTISPECIES: surface-adhesin E family protein [Acidithiobacillus]|nr:MULTISPECIES: surface-adhesin E family protein [Acidithiobacillus]MBU2740672.1 hypothetical protein [Acidithiobacillus albertensis]MBU2750944.1 hypothetical protein [Acidithiobacillus thiooxidans]MBU2792549.1 hypothetical protein [Acidithiobacillus thiooxidans]MBU2837229.1 hypothetical protein [Acidithiobacillus thiooxidans]MDX5936401.1 hypothetical protein [Acidithiobacillus thiooxidans]